MIFSSKHGHIDHIAVVVITSNFDQISMRANLDACHYGAVTLGVQRLDHILCVTTYTTTVGKIEKGISVITEEFR